MLQATKKLLLRVVGAVVGIAIFTATLVFAWILALVVGAIALAAWAYLSWRFRALEKEAARRGDGSVVIEGEYRVEREVAKTIGRDRADGGDAGTAKRPPRQGP